MVGTEASMSGWKTSGPFQDQNFTICIYRAVATGTASTAIAVPLFDQVPYKFERVIFFYNGTYHNNYVYCIRNILMILANSAKAQLQRLNTQYFARIVLTRNKISNVLI